MVRFVIRHPKIFSSPKSLAVELGVKTRLPRPGKSGDYRQDFFMHYPEPGLVRNGGADYVKLSEFYSANKAVQRLLLQHDGLPIPQTRVAGEPLEGNRFVVRPLRHQQGQHFRVTERADDFRPGLEYISELFPKSHEYRVICVYGKPALLLRKQAAEGVRLLPDQAWNHSNGQAVFSTVEDVPRSNLSVHTDCFVRLLDSSIVRNSHYCGVDILYRGKTKEWVVCEINSCPALQIDANRAKVAQIIREQRA